MNKRLLIVLLLLSPLMLAASLIRGTVLDTTKALIPGATVEMENLATGQKQTTLSDDRGSFSFTNVILGKVRVTVTLTGFQKWTQVVQVGTQPIELWATLQISSAATTVEVTASAPSTVSQSSASVGQVVITTRSGTGGGEQNRARVRGPRPMNTESYDYIADNPFIAVKQQPRSTFAVDVDTASYANMRRFLNEGMLPPKDAVRIEEMVNYFKYAYPPPDGPAPVAIHTEVAPAFWNPTHRLVRIGIRARDIDISARKSANLVFLIDVSGSMMEEAKLPLVQRSLHLMVDPLREDDKLKYQKENKPDTTHKGELLTVSLRYKLPEGTNSRLIAAPVPDSKVSFEAASPDFQFAAAVAAFGMVLRDSPHKGSATVGMIIDFASRHTGQDPSRSEFVDLGRKAVLLLN